MNSLKQRVPKSVSGQPSGNCAVRWSSPGWLDGWLDGRREKPGHKTPPRWPVCLSRRKLCGVLNSLPGGQTVFEIAVHVSARAIIVQGCTKDGPQVPRLEANARVGLGTNGSIGAAMQWQNLALKMLASSPLPFSPSPPTAVAAAISPHLHCLILNLIQSANVCMKQPLDEEEQLCCLLLLLKPSAIFGSHWQKGARERARDLKAKYQSSAERYFAQSALTTSPGFNSRQFQKEKGDSRTIDPSSSSLHSSHSDFPLTDGQHRGRNGNRVNDLRF